MRKIIYYVASSLDGYIDGPNGDISAFAASGPGVDQYLKDLQAFDTVIMGRKTYEFGYQFGLSPGQPAYPHMKHYVFSRSLRFDQSHPLVEVCPYEMDRIKDLKQTVGSDIYLCGGGQFAGWLLEHGLIDVLKLKLNPIILGGGTPLFGPSQATALGELVDQQVFSGGLQILTYELGN